MQNKRNFTIAIPTRGRAATGTTFNLFPEAILFMHKEEKQTYRDAGVKNQIVTHKCKSSSAARNFILDYFEEGDNVLMLDDDIKKVGWYILKGKKYKSEQLTSSVFLDHIANGFVLCKKENARLFGVAPTTNSLNYTGKQISVATFVNGPCTGIVVGKLRYDEQCVNKNDYDMTLQHIKAGFKTFRLDYLWQQNDYNKMEGGTRFYRTKEKERETYYYMLGKWDGYLSPNPKRELEFIMRVRKRFH